MANKYADILRFCTPAGWWGEKWREGLYLGNGKTGANVFGGASEEKILINDASLNWMGRTTVVPDISQGIDILREHISNGEFLAAQKVIPTMLDQRDFRPQPEYPLPMCEVNLMFFQDEITTNYNRSLNMANGEAVVTYNVGETQYKRCAFVSREQDIVVMRITKKGPTPINAKISIDLPHRVNARTYEGVCPMPEQGVFAVEKPFVSFSVHHEQTISDYGIVAKILNVGGTLRTEEDGLVVLNAQSVTIIFKTFVNGKSQRCIAENKAYLNGIKDNYEKLFKAHSQLHNKLYATSSLSLCDDDDQFIEDLLLDLNGNNLPALLAEKIYRFSRYLMVACTNDEGRLINPTGLWNGCYKAYRAFVCHSGETQMAYLHALQGNMFANIDKTLDFYLDHIDDFRNNAQRLYNCRGIVVPVVCAPKTGRLGTKDVFALHFTGCGAWVANFFCKFAKYTQNAKLEKRLIPFMQEIANFYCDYFQFVDGKVQIVPSVLSMRIADGYKVSDNRPFVSKNSVLEYALAKELLQSLIELCRKHGVKGDFPRWNKIIDGIPQPQIGGDNCFKEFVDSIVSSDYTGISVGTLYSAYFGNQVDMFSDEQTIECFTATADKKRSLPSSQNSYYMSILGGVYARLGDGQKAKTCLANVVRGCAMNNLVFVDKDWRGMGICGSGVWTPVQIHANMVFANDIQQMLMYSNNDVVKIFPALPDEWTNVAFQDFVSQNGVMISCRYNKAKGSLYLTLESKKERALQLYLPSFIKKLTKTNLETKPRGKVLELQLQANQKVELLYKC